jgi:type IV pilus assembly protein PilY1
MLQKAFSAGLVGAFLLGTTAIIPTTASAQAIIDNGVVQLGVGAFGALNVPGGAPAAGSGTTIVGLRSVATGSDSTSPGCQCEGWGVGIRSTGVFGQSNNDVGGVQNLSLVSFTSTASTARSVVNVLNSSGATVLRVTHDYRPNAGTSALYQVDVTIENLTGTDLAAGDLVYRRVMDWDIPSPGGELVTIQGVPAALGIANGSNVFRTDNNGFNAGNPFSFSSFGLQDQNFVDATGDIGALFDFEFEALANGASRAFSTYYGVAPNRAAADLARSLADGDATDVDISLYSYGYPRVGSFPGSDGAGVPNTFIFGFGTTGGVLEPPPPVGVPAPGALGLLGVGLLGLAAVGRRRRA